MNKFITLNQLMLYTDEFFFTSSTNPKEKDTIVICNPSDAICLSPVVMHSRKSLQDHIAYIQKNQIKKAIVVAEDINFLTQCLGLEYLWIIPAVSAKDFDYSPIYKMPNIKQLICETIYGAQDEKMAYLDYSKLSGVKYLSVDGGKRAEGLCFLKGLKSLCLSKYPYSEDLETSFDGSELENLVIIQSSIRSLDGIDSAKKLKRLELSYNRRLTDISALLEIKDSLIWLDIEYCGKIKDFSVLSELHNIQLLRLQGSNVLPNLDFIKNMPNLKFLVLKMNVSDGDLSRCENIPYVVITNRKHFTHKSENFSKESSMVVDIGWYMNEV